MSRWNSCNILQLAPDASRLWQFEAKGDFRLNREHRAAADAPLPARFVAKSWSSLWQPKLNVAWLPPEHVFLRVIELPQSNFDETAAMVELQLEKLSPRPVAQIVWTIRVLPGTAENLQTVVVVIAERAPAEEFLGKLEARGFLADRLEAPMLDQLEAPPATAADAWIYPFLSNGQHIALVAWWFGGALRSLSFVVLPAADGRAAGLKNQLAQLVWAGELEGWLTTQPQWHLVADPVNAAEWETALRDGLNEPVETAPPLPPAELAARTARHAAQAPVSANAALLPIEFSTRYQQQFVDRLWLRGLFAAGVLYAIAVVIYFCATSVLGYKTRQVERQVAMISGNYTNVLQLKARYDILKERQDLKFAALDCWKVVAEQLPQTVTLQRFSFANGQQLTLSGTAPSDQIETLFDFNSAMQKVALNGKPMFADQGGTPVSPRQTPNNQVSWSFSLPLQNKEAAP